MQTTTEPNYVETVAPIDIQTLKRQFSEDDVVFVIDYQASKIKGQVFLTYLSNLDIPCHVRIEDVESGLELLAAYLKSPTLVNIPELEDLAMNVMMFANGLEHELDFDPAAFIEQYQDDIEHWLVRLESLSLFCVYCVEEADCKDYVASFPEDDTTTMVGCNFLNLIRHSDFPILIADPKPERLRYFSKYFNEYIFKGNNLFAFWAVEENPLYVMTEGIISGTFDQKAFDACIKEDVAVLTEILEEPSS